MAEAAEIIGSKQAVVLGKTYGVTEIVGSSGDGSEKAIRDGLDRAATLRHLDWFQVVEVRGAFLYIGAGASYAGRRHHLG